MILGMRKPTEPDTALVRDVQRALADCDRDVHDAYARRDAEIRQIQEKHGCNQAAIVRASGLSRESVRQILNPDARAAAREQTAKRRSESEG